MSRYRYGLDVQTNKQTDKPNLYIDSMMITLKHVYYKIHNEVSKNYKYVPSPKCITYVLRPCVENPMKSFETS